MVTVPERFTKQEQKTAIDAHTPPGSAYCGTRNLEPKYAALLRLDRLAVDVFLQFRQDI